MDISDFIILSLNEKGNVVFNQGHHVDVVFEGTIRYVLYSLELFWVEVVYDTYKNQIIDINSFESGNRLDRFSNLSHK